MVCQYINSNEEVKKFNECFTFATVGEITYKTLLECGFLIAVSEIKYKIYLQWLNVDFSVLEMYTSVIDYFWQFFPLSSRKD